jgi:hypothetical protein
VVDHADAGALGEKYRRTASTSTPSTSWTCSGTGVTVDAPRDRARSTILRPTSSNIPDPIGFLVDCEKLLVPSGVLSLAVPDSRYCFDCLRPLTSTASGRRAADRPHAAHGGNRARHTLHAAKRGAITWHAGATEPLAMVHQRDHVDEMLARSGTGDDYVDVHAWVFTPASFRYLIEMACALGYTSLVVAEHHDTVGFEFYVSLQRPVVEITPEARTRAFDERLAPMTEMVSITEVEPLRRRMS